MTKTYDEMIIELKTPVNYWCHWSSTNEGFDFWDVVDKELMSKIRKKGTPWLTSPIPTIIEVDI